MTRRHWLMVLIGFLVWAAFMAMVVCAIRQFANG
jgi:hypothetical protein